METSNVISTLSEIPVGTIIAWVIVLSSIVSLVVSGLVKLYGIFKRADKMQDDNAEFRKMVEDHDVKLKDIIQMLDIIKNKLDTRDKAELTDMRYQIVRAGEEYVSNGHLTIRQLRVLEEMFQEYHSRQGNGYVTTLMKKVRTLPVIGKLDENDDDIDDED